MSLTGDGCFVKDKEAFGVCRLDRVTFSRCTRDSKEETDLPSAAARRGNTGESSSWTFYLSVLAGQNASWRGFNRMSCSGFDSPHVLRSPPLIYNAFHSALKQTVAFYISCSVPLDVVQQWIVLRAVLKSSGTRQSRLLNHYLLIHFTQPGVIMHGPVNGYLSMPHIYLIISRSGGEDKSTDCVHCEAFSAGGET